jgi:hypothetical protein
MKVVNDLEKLGFHTVTLGTSAEEYQKKYRKRKISGIDLSKKNSSSAFFVPCKSSLFEIHNSSAGSKAGSGEFIPCKFIQYENVEHEEFHVDFIKIEKTKKDSKKIQKVGMKKNKNQLKQDQLVEKIRSIIKTMVPGNRSSLACVVGGMLKFIKDPILKRELIFEATRTGIDEQAQKMMIQYSRS